MTTLSRLHRPLQAAMFAIGLVVCSAGLAQTGHDHGSASSASLKLDAGKRWSTDAPLRQGMTSIRTSLASRLDAAHAGRLTDAQYKTLAKDINGQIAFIVQNCKLPPAADAVLHVIVAEVAAGADAMDGKVKGTAPRDGFVKVVQALDNYAKYFDHSGWQPLGH